MLVFNNLKEMKKKKLFFLTFPIEREKKEEEDKERKKQEKELGKKKFIYIEKNHTKIYKNTQKITHNKTLTVNNLI